ITLPYFPNEIFKGTVTYIYPVLDPKTRTVKVRFELPNPDWKLKPDMFANVNMQISLGERLVVPSTAVLDSGTRQVVFVDEGRGMFEARNVALGVRTRDWYEIRKGIKPGDMVVTSGNFLIDSESSLKAATGMMMPGMDMGSKEKAGPSSKESQP
ncbi:MAG: efflux RND transporter periplasmic adaptor subunit, partial [Nitrospira sp.]|nr:efflux RND transporter periplasmic adaptor subunit [Nitrospira sp.]